MERKLAMLTLSLVTFTVLSKDFLPELMRRQVDS